ncbi:hypothetical protein CHAB381_0942 [Campylobacter hominis ATCC BAA-381]|uniref:Uncharacterized protein n=1 Tax=Campylobacter hominis (strain ATCC BAA-381 / DSM 21671 / CCUG 45161 / LMG 19568 / NCTC 13146 / CH001A) TaxID=360107 RepID=A7I1W2_CAMHC|nr:hypothetical protein CHAB381_0942 [Campylobacter hominis ATCC BAA-381]
MIKPHYKFLFFNVILSPLIHFQIDFTARKFMQRYKGFKNFKFAN